VVVLTGHISAPWHIYAPTTPPGGPIATTITLDTAKSPGLSAAGKLGEAKPKRFMDQGFGIFVETYEGQTKFELPVKIAPAAPASGGGALSVHFQTCNDRTCLPPKTVSVPFQYTLGAGAPRPDHLKAVLISGSVAGGTASGSAAPIVLGHADDGALAPFLLLAAASGFAALLTPCVFPMIPITVSVFTKGDPAQRGLARPLAYCAGIIFTFTGIGLLASALFGAAGIPRLAANPWLNLGMAALFVGLSFNLFGFYEIVVPSKLLNAVQPKGHGTLVGPALMGFVFSLTSFTCTVPFVGTALFSAATGPVLRPVLGMLVFSSCFALPFFLLALFPNWLVKLPRAGHWLVSVKAFLGFLELAAALKFVQQADYTWQLGLLTRPLFLAIWAIIATTAALYLFKVIGLPNESKSTPVGPGRRMLGYAMFAVALILVNATHGTSLAVLDAYLPAPDYGGHRNLHSPWLKDNYLAAVQLAQNEHKPLLVNFTGYACTNCRLMEQHVLSDPLVAAEYPNFVTVELHTDGPDAASQANSTLQQQKLGTVAIPVYAVFSPEGKLQGQLEGLELDPHKFVDFLDKARQVTPGT